MAHDLTRNLPEPSLNLPHDTKHGNKTTVGDSPRGPPKQLGNPHWKPATKPKPNTPRLTLQDTAHAAETPTAHQGGPLEDPLEQALPRSRMRASLRRAPPRSRGCAYLEQAPPRSRVRSALERGPPCSRALRTRAPAPVRGHLMPWQRRGGAIMRLGLAPRCRRTNSPGASPSPPLWGDCAAWLVPVPWRCAACPGTANAPSPRRGAGRTLDLLFLWPCRVRWRR
jgi:hypothetical protein